MPRTVEDEMAEARATTEDIGRARTCARRAVGMVIQTTLGLGFGPGFYAATYIDALRRLADDLHFPETVRHAATRLVDRSNKERQSASTNPVQDAEIILEFLAQLSSQNK
jgi:transcription initiation factor TFIIIB Brf1 subunit/transcription initiation factor TFIIB